ncbi:serine/threonine-protein kinase [Frigoriglobus tundricola]|uniref:Protein kinase domain-containing protein n=1 Tax=Frigoriglobus tundricola TaxID=2774151 RepID=A0A6M5Z4X1_9BACT|nr:serine/threonine-protein kinase [Frigoriglobus tundricola]QJX00765.1 hypothetical protein FTUN_8403 [Frigoriglobus tundricola]
MTVPPRTPNESALREFLLGALPPDRAEQVREWLDADSAHAAQLEHIAAHDPLTDAVSDTVDVDTVPADAVERVIHNVNCAIRKAPAEDRPGPSVGIGPSVPSPASESGLPWPPTRLSHYRIVGELGHGGMGYVFEAEDEKLGRRVAVKVLSPDLARRSDAGPRFLDEARHAAAVEHENVVPILHVGEDAGAPFIVMPLLKGEPLAARLKRDGKLPGAEIARIGRDVAAGLAAAHATGVVHRDIKPANVWLDADTGRARVLDFGLARFGSGAEARNNEWVLEGTPGYMAPEQIGGRPATPRSDLFSLGATLYECASGEKAFDGPSLTAVLKAVGEHHPAPLAVVNPEVPEPVSVLVQRLLAKNPAGRPANARDVVAALRDEPITEGSSGWDTVTRVDLGPRSEPHGRRKWLLGVGSVAVGALAAASWLATHPAPLSDSTTTKPDVRPPVKYRGQVDVKIRRELVPGTPQMVRLNQAGALPLTRSDEFRIEAEIDPPAYLYLVWVDPNRDVTPVYPWDPTAGAKQVDPWTTRPAQEESVGTLNLPRGAQSYLAPKSRPGVATMVLLARPTPLDVPDSQVKGWFEALPDLPLPPGGDTGVVWFDDFTPSADPFRRRTFETVGGDDPFVRWQAQLQKTIGRTFAYQTSVSFARTGNK